MRRHNIYLKVIKRKDDKDILADMDPNGKKYLICVTK